MIGPPLPFPPVARKLPARYIRSGWRGILAARRTLNATRPLEAP